MSLLGLEFNHASKRVPWSLTTIQHNNTQIECMILCMHPETSLLVNANREWRILADSQPLTSIVVRPHLCLFLLPVYCLELTIISSWITDFLQNTQNNHPIHHKWEWVMGCLLWVKWVSCQIRKIAGAHAPGMPGTFSPPPQVSDPDMHHGMCVMHVLWCMPELLTSGFLWSRRVEKTNPAFPAHVQPAILRIW